MLAKEELTPYLLLAGVSWSCTYLEEHIPKAPQSPESAKPAKCGLLYGEPTGPGPPNLSIRSCHNLQQLAFAQVLSGPSLLIINVSATSNIHQDSSMVEIVLSHQSPALLVVRWSFQTEINNVLNGCNWKASLVHSVICNESHEYVLISSDPRVQQTSTASARKLILQRPRFHKSCLPSQRDIAQRTLRYIAFLIPCPLVACIFNRSVCTQSEMSEWYYKIWMRPSLEQHASLF
jgi:hypothetical protein